MQPAREILTVKWARSKVWSHSDQRRRVALMPFLGSDVADALADRQPIELARPDGTVICTTAELWRCGPQAIVVLSPLIMEQDIPLGTKVMIRENPRRNPSTEDGSS